MLKVLREEPVKSRRLKVERDHKRPDGSALAVVFVWCPKFVRNDRNAYI
jgi:hypothetical protein